MSNVGTSEADLLNELAELRRRVAELEANELEHKRIEKQLRLQAQLLDSVQESIVATDLESRVIYWSKGAEALVGYSAEETIGKPIALYAQPAIEENSESISQVLKNGSWHEQTWRQRKDGSRYFADSSVTLVRDENGLPVGMMGLERDITEQVQAQEALKASEERYRTLLEIISDYAYSFRVEPDGTTVADWLTEDSFTRLTGYTSEEINSLGTSALFHPDDKPFAEQQIREVRQGRAVEGEYRLITKSGDIRWVRLDRKPVWDERENRIVRLYGVVQDITERKQAQEALKASEERHRIISELISDYAYSYEVAPDGSLTAAWLTNDSFFRITGYTWDELGTSYKLYHPDDVERVKQDLEDVLKGKPTYSEYRIITKSGEVRWLLLSRYPVWDERQKRVICYYGAAQDITQNKHNEQALRASEAKFRSIFEHASDGMRLVDSDGIILDWNRASERITGLTREQVVGQPIADVLFQLMPNEKQSPDTLERLRKRSSQMLQIHLDEPVSHQVFLYRKDGTKRVIHEEVTPIEVEGKVIFCGIVRDVTEREQAEQQRLALALEKKRSEMLGMLTAQLAHDFKTPLTAINTSLYLLERYTDAGKRQEKINIIQEQVHKLAAFIQDLLVLPHLEREPELQLTPVALNDLIRDIEAEFRPLAERKHLQFTLHLAEDLPLVSADLMNIRRAITNLVENAVNYTPEGGTITIRTDQQDNAALVEVTDTGIGMDKADMARIFERFYRSAQAQKISGSGSGLGLPIVKRIVEMHGGHIEVESVLSKGSTFRIHLPL